MPKAKSNPKPDPKAANPSSDPGDAPKTPTFPTLPEGAHDLASLSAVLGKPAEALRRILLRHQNEASLYEWGVAALTGHILADVPRQ